MEILASSRTPGPQVLRIITKPWAEPQRADHLHVCQAFGRKGNKKPFPGSLSTDRLDSQSVVCVHSVGLGSSWLVLVIFLNVSRGSTLFMSLYISFA